MLLKKVVGRSRLYDILHKGWVNTCVFATLVSLGGLIAVNYSAYMKKNASKEEAVNKESNADLAAVNTENESELL